MLHELSFGEKKPGKYRDDQSESRPRVLVVCSPTAALPIDSFLVNSFCVEHVSSNVTLETALALNSFDLVLVDSVFSGADTVSVITLVRTVSAHPYLIVRAETNDDVDRVLALEVGADDCIAFSCSHSELKARVRAFFRRHLIETAVPTCTPLKSRYDLYSSIAFSGWSLNRNRCELTSPSHTVISLTQTEYLILLELFSDPGLIKSREELRRSSNDMTILDDNRLTDVFISRIRKKIRNHTKRQLIETVRGKGYRLLNG